jgi:hypothetical protein
MHERALYVYDVYQATALRKKKPGTRPGSGNGAASHHRPPANHLKTLALSALHPPLSNHAHGARLRFFQPVDVRTCQALAALPLGAFDHHRKINRLNKKDPVGVYQARADGNLNNAVFGSATTSFTVQ